MGCSLGYHIKHDYHLPTMLASKDLEHVYEKVLQVRRQTAVAAAAWPPAPL